MADSSVFDSVHDPVPPVRNDLRLIPVQHNGTMHLYVHDDLGYVPQDFALNGAIEPVLSLINGKYSIRDICRILQDQVDPDNLLDFIRLLDEHCILDSSFKKHLAREKEAEFETAAERPAALPGHSYPAQRDQLEDFLDSILATGRKDRNGISPEKALYAPHIDLRVGSQMYADVFSTLKGLTPLRVILLATAHYSGYYPEVYQNRPFIGSRKTFQLPNGNIPADTEVLDRLAEAADAIGYTEQDRAHRIEHSIELHLLFARHIWKHEFRIVPILVSSFDELFYMQDGHLSHQISNFSRLLRELDNEDTFYLISGDLAHVGRKFGDTKDAEELRPDVEKFDDLFLDAAAVGDKRKLVSHISEGFDPYRICGFPPLYTFMNLFPELKGNRIGYHWWDETETKSAVSFGSISY